MCGSKTCERRDQEGELPLGSSFPPLPEKATRRPRIELGFDSPRDWGDPAGLYPRTMDLSEDAFAPSGDIGQCLETFLVVTIEGVLLFSSGKRSRMLFNILQGTGWLPHHKDDLVKMSIMLRLRGHSRRQGELETNQSSQRLRPSFWLPQSQKISGWIFSPGS